MIDRDRSATTLIELMIVTVVIGILALVLVPRVERARQEVYLTEARAQLDSATWQARRYHAVQSSYAGFDSVFDAEGDVVVTFPWLRTDGMLASAQHARLPDRVCHLVVGRVPGTMVPEGVVPGRPVCVEV